MKIERIRVDAFGRLSAFDTGAESLGSLVIVLGPNEAGKSTLFNFLTTSLYGFQPASRERNPNVPWGADEASGGIQIKLSSGACADVRRRLRSAPSGKMKEAGVVRELRNQPLPWVAHIPRAVFRQVFAVTLADLAGLNDETWAHIQDRIVGSMGSSDMRSARSVADTLEREAAEIWRPNRRGNQRLRDVHEEVRRLRTRRLGALDRDRKIRALIEERENVLVRLREVRSERHAHRVAIERVQRLLPVRRQLLRIEALRDEGGPLAELRTFPPDPVFALDRLEEECSRADGRIAELLRAELEAGAELKRLDGATRTLLQHGDEITRLVALTAGTSPDRLKCRELEAELGELNIKLRAAGEHFLEGGWTDELAEPIGSVSVALLQDRIGRTRQSPQVATPATRPPSVAPPLAASGGAALGGAALLAWSAAGGPATAQIVGTALFTLGALGGWLHAKGRGAGARGAGADSDGASGAGEGVARILTNVPVRPEYLDPAGDPLLSGVSRLQELISARRQATETHRLSQERVRTADEAGQRVAEALGRDVPANAEGLAPVLERELREAERIRDAAESAERDINRISGELEALQEEAARAKRGLETLERDLSRIDDKGPAGAARRAKSRLAAHARADQLEEELSRGNPDLAELTAQIESHDRSGGAWTMDDDELARRRAHLDELEAETERLIAEAEALHRNADHLREMETVDAVDGEIATLQETEARLTRERDRKWVLARLVRDADRRFREEHQPDLIRRASEHLKRLTLGRYDRLLVDEARSEGFFLLMGPSLPAPVPLQPPVSTGTLEQAYLSLRLAIVDHLDQGPERLPLFIDEAFVNWDRGRREPGLDVLAELSGSRQLFVFTCHPAMAAEIESRGGRILRLEPDA